MKKHLNRIGIICLGIGLVTLAESCKKEQGCMDDTATNYSATAEEDDGSCIYDTEPTNDLPETYLVFDADTFYYSGQSTAPDQNAFRHNIRFSTKEELSETTNDGQTASTMSLALTFKEKPSSGATSYFSKDRFPDEGSDSLNFYLSMFINTGHAYEGENFLSPSSGSMTYTIDGGKFTVTVPSVEMILESDQTKSVTMQGGYIKVDW